jgi:hypothetical protein
MLGIQKTLAWLAIISSSAVSGYPEVVSLPVRPYDSCSTNNYVGGECVSFRFVGVERGKPFTGQRVVTSVGHNLDGTSKTVKWTELTARDSGGRIRFEQQSALKPPDWRVASSMSNHEIEKIMIPGGVSGPLITIFDCFNGKGIVLQPELHVAHVMQTCDTFKPFQQDNQPYSHLLSIFLDAKKLPPNVSIEDLGYREIEGTMAHGIRSTSVGAEKDGEWNERPIRVMEDWMSDELAVTALYVQSDLRAHSETKSMFTNIKMAEPEASLFEIPPGYKISLTQDTT